MLDSSMHGLESGYNGGNVSLQCGETYGRGGDGECYGLQQEKTA